MAALTEEQRLLANLSLAGMSLTMLQSSLAMVAAVASVAQPLAGTDAQSFDAATQTVETITRGLRTAVANGDAMAADLLRLFGDVGDPIPGMPASPFATPPNFPAFQG